MDKQTYEELKNSIDTIHGMVQTYRHLFIFSDVLKIKRFIESQKPLEIVVGGMYEIKSNFHARDGETGESVIFNPHLLIEVENVSPNFVVFDYEYSLFSICKDQFNQHNFMKVEDK